LRLELEAESRKSNQVMDVRLEFEAKLDKKDADIHELQEQVAKLTDDIKGKD
jgi:hypothetical protein